MTADPEDSFESRDVDDTDDTEDGEEGGANSAKTPVSLLQVKLISSTTTVYC